MRQIIILLLLLTCSYHSNSQANKRYLRGTWITTVYNIDWPSSRSLNADQQKQEMASLLDKVQASHMNTVVLQIRPNADACYQSSLEPWSYWLSGEQGKDPGYDPLQFTIDECHKRGLNIHVWLNAYRVNPDTSSNKVYAPTHVIHQHPNWFVTYGKTLYFDPGVDSARIFLTEVVKDIVKRYDIDVLHIDDYFYPYKLAGIDFPDSLTFATYPRGFSKLDDWRRDNVNMAIQEISEVIKAEKPWVEFGISPFGVWRNKGKDPKGSETRSLTNYDDLYADVLLWQGKGWIDHVIPQLYFNIGNPAANYSVLTEWWSRNTEGANLYIGLSPYKVSKKAKEKEWHSSKEIHRQLKRNATDPNIKGEVFFSAKSLFSKELGLEKRLPKKEYKYLSISPENNRIARIEPEAPMDASISVQDKHTLQLKWTRGKNAKRFVVYKFRKDKAVDMENPKHIVAVTGLDQVTIPYKNKRELKRYWYGITSLSPTHSESAMVKLELGDL